MNIETKFNLGDIVFSIHSFRKSTWVECEYCKGNRQITIAESDRKIKCPQCYGNGGGKQLDPDVKWHVSDETKTIGNVRASVYAERYDHENEEQYMACETGVGSGSLYYANQLFATFEEAQAECDRRNTEQ